MSEPLTSPTPNGRSPSPDSAADPVRRRITAVGYVVLALFCLGVVAWSFWGVGFSPLYLAQHVWHGVKTVEEFLPPDTSKTFVRSEVASMLSTIQMAVVGTLIGALGALPFSFFAARTTSMIRGISSLIKVLMNIFRATPIVVYAIILAAMVGLGEQTGSLAIAIGTFVMLTKLYAEALEPNAAGPVEAVRAAGGNTAQTFVFGMLPQVLPGYVATTLYAFELNVQASFILGFVGAGGIGYDLLNYIHLFQWQQVCTILIITVVVVNIADLISYGIRRLIS